MPVRFFGRPWEQDQTDTRKPTCGWEFSTLPRPLHYLLMFRPFLKFVYASVRESHFQRLTRCSWEWEAGSKLQIAKLLQLQNASAIPEIKPADLADRPSSQLRSSGVRRLKRFAFEWWCSVYFCVVFIAIPWPLHLQTLLKVYVGHEQKWKARGEKKIPNIANVQNPGSSERRAARSGDCPPAC